jgi:spermidine/putrescine-binding protein
MLKVIIMLLFITSPNTSFSIQKMDTLKILSWPNYFSPEFIKEFEKEEGVQVQLTYYYSNLMRDKLMSDPILSNVYDVITSSEKSVADYANMGLLKPLSDDTFQSSVKSVKNKVVEKFAAYISFSTIGIAYHKDKVKPLNSWFELFSLPIEYSGKVEVPKVADDFMDIALMANGSSVSRYTMSDILGTAGLARSFVTRIRPFVEKSEQENRFYDGDVLYKVMYATEASFYASKNENIGFFYPGNETRIWRDFIGVHKNTSLEDKAFAFIRKTISKEGALLLADYSWYPPSHEGAYSELKKEEFDIPLKKTVFTEQSLLIHNARHLDHKMELKKAYLYERIIDATSQTSN